MLSEYFKQSIHKASTEKLREALMLLLKPHTEPVFGAAKMVEHEVAALNALKLLGYINPDADEFDLVEALRISKSKARFLLQRFGA